VLDAIVQISLFVKLKLQKCAPILGLPGVGFFMAAQTRVNPTYAAGYAPDYFARAPRPNRS